MTVLDRWTAASPRRPKHEPITTRTANLGYYNGWKPWNSTDIVASEAVVPKIWPTIASGFTCLSSP